MKRAYIIFLINIIPLNFAVAQVYFGAELTPDAFSKTEEPRFEKPQIDPFAAALSQYFSSSTLVEVFESTEPEKQVTQYTGQGFYRQEIITLMLISEKTKEPFKKLAKERDKGKSFEDFAKKYSIDLYELFEKSVDIKKEIEKKLPAPVAPLAPVGMPADISISNAPLKNGTTVYNPPEIELSSTTDQ